MKTVSTTIITVFLCLMHIFNVTSQTTGKTIILDTIVPSGDYIAHDWILLNPGFAFTTTGSSTFQASIDVSLLYDVEYLSEQPGIDRELDFSLPVGSIQGAFNVISNGAATYNIPIDVPPGTADMQPQVAIVYSSQAGNGLLGLGFDLAGLSSIARVPKTKFSNNSIGGITYTMDDIFAVDGNQLKLTSGTYGANGSVYGTENETFSRITAYGIAGIGPQWFKVETKDGKTLEYGKEADSRMEPNGTSTVLIWKLNKLSDANGNYVRFIYRKENYESAISRIEYTANDSAELVPYNTIEFTYAKKEDTRKIYVSSHYVNQSLILETIKVKNEEKLIRKYDFSYTEDVFSHLAQIEIRNGDNEKLNSTVFNWGGYNKNVIVSDYSIEGDDGLTPLGTGYRTSGDLNGDGLTDIIDFFTIKEFVANNWTTHNVLRPSYARLNADGTTTFTIGTPWKFFPNVQWDGYTSFNVVSCVQNVNGDSNPDIIIPDYDYYEGRWNILHLYVKNLDIEEVQEYNLNLQSYTRKMPSFTVDDLNNDGIDDFVVVEGDESLNIQKLNIRYRSNSWEEPAIWITKVLNSDYDNVPERVYVSDFDADGMKELMIISKKGYKIYPYTELLNDGNTFATAKYSSTSIKSNNFFLEPGDFNGDGLVDFVFSTKSNNWALAINNGDGGFTLRPQVNITVTTTEDLDDDKDRIKVLDFNNDGKSDVVIGDLTYEYIIIPKDFTVLWYASTGEDLELAKSATSSDDRNSYNKFLTGDFNGDGRVDMLYFGFECYNNSSEDKRYRIYHSFNSTFDEGLVKSILDGYNRKTDLHYLPLTKSKTPTGSDFYVKGTSCVYPLSDIKVPFYCLWKVAMPNVDGKKDTTEYWYREAKIHNQGLGFLGFKQVITQNAQLNWKTINTNTIDNTYFRLTKQVNEVYKASGKGISRGETNFNTDIYNNKYFSRPYLTIQTDSLTNSTVTSNLYYFSDNSGNLSEIDKDFENGFTERTWFLYTNAGSYMPNKPEYIDITRKHPDDEFESYTRTSSNYDTTTGNLLWVKNNYNEEGKEVTTTYSNYTRFGQPQVVTQSAPDVTSVVTNYVYDAKGRFLKEETGALGTVKYENNPTFGMTSSVTGINNKTAISYYDNWGRLTKNLSPDSVSTYYELNWAEGDGAENALYYSYTIPEDKPWVKTWYDLNGKVLREESVGFNNISIYTDHTYTPSGQVDTTMTYMGGVLTNQVDYNYYDDGRLQSETYMGGKVVSYTYEGKTVTTTTDGKTYSKTFDNWGNVDSVEEPSPGGEINYTYYSNGKPWQIISPASTTVSMTYDEAGNQITLIDPDAGTIEYDYDAYGRLIYQKDNKGNEDSIHYDFAGRIDYKKNKLNEKTDYDYVASGNGIGQLKKITAPNDSYQQYDYDGFGRAVKTTQHIDNTISDIIFQYRYNEMGNVDTIIYPGNYKIDQAYDNFGNIVTVKNGSTNIWALNELTATKMKYSLGNNGMFTEKSFDDYGLMKSCSTKVGANVIQYQYYDFNPVNGLLRSREDRRTEYLLKEVFAYDDLYRLTNWDITKNGTNKVYNSLTYKTNMSGNINVKSGIGTYDYLSGRPHAIDNLTAAANCPVSLLDQNIDFNSLNKVNYIEENNYKITFTYGPDEQRIKTALTQNGTLKKTTYFGGLYEKTVVQGGETKEILYIPAGDGLAAAYIKSSTSGNNLYYVHKDHLGSLVSLTDGNGDIKEQYNYDPWGRRRNPTTWGYANVTAPTYLTRGFTGHEHLEEFALINMNGRVYDPVLGMFLSPDNYVQAPDFSQSFNRYSYCFNNPLIFTDPTGEFGVVETLAVLLFTYYGGVQANFMNSFNEGGNPFNPGDWDWGSFSTYYGMASGAYQGYSMTLQNCEYIYDINSLNGKPLTLISHEGEGKFDIVHYGYWVDDYGFMQLGETVVTNVPLGGVDNIRNIASANLMASSLLNAQSGGYYSMPTSHTQKDIQNSTALDLGLGKVTFESSHQTTISSIKTGMTLNTLVTDKFFTRKQIRYSSPNLTVNGFANGFDMRVTLDKYSMSFGLEYGPNSMGYGLTNTIGYGINNGGIISGQTMKGESSLRTLLIPLGIAIWAYLPGLSPVLKTAY